MLMGVPAETATGETRVAVTPATAKKLIAQGHTVRVQSGAGRLIGLVGGAGAQAGAGLHTHRVALRDELLVRLGGRGDAGRTRRRIGRHPYHPGISPRSTLGRG